MRMGGSMRFAQRSRRIGLDQALHTQPRGWLPAFDTKRLGHKIARHQNHRAARQRHAFALADSLDACLGRCPKIVDMRHFYIWAKDLIDPPRFGDLLALPAAANRKSAEVPAAFQPDRA